MQQIIKNQKAINEMEAPTIFNPRKQECFERVLNSDEWIGKIPCTNNDSCENK